MQSQNTTHKKLGERGRVHQESHKERIKMFHSLSYVEFLKTVRTSKEYSWGLKKHKLTDLALS